MVAPNLVPANVALADFVDGAAALAAGWKETGANPDLNIVTPDPAPPIGTKAYTNTCTGTGTSNTDSPRYVLPEGTTNISVGIWGKWRTGATPRNVRLDIRQYDSVGAASTLVGSQTTSSTSYVRQKRENIALTAGTVEVELRVATLSNAAGDTLEFTGVQIETGATLSDEIVAPTTPSFPRVFVCENPLRQIKLILPSSAPVMSEADQIRAATNLPVNDTDAQIQQNDFSGFTNVSTYSALRSTLLAGGKAKVPSGVTISCTGDLRVVTGSALYVEEGAEVRRDFSGGGFIETNQLTGGTGYYNEIIPSHNVYFGGPGKITAGVANPSTGAPHSGNFFVVSGDNIVFDSFEADNWTGGRYLCFVGDNPRVRRVDWEGVGASGAGGLRLMGGRGFRCIDSRIVSGDDVYQCVPAGGFNDPFFSVSIYDAIYVGGYGQSHSGRVIVCGNQDQNDNAVATMNCNIGGPAVEDRIRFIEIDGHSGATAIAFQNKSSSGLIQNVWVENSRVSGALAPSDPYRGQGGAVYANGVTNWVQDIHLINTEVVDHHRPGFDGGPLEKVGGLGPTVGVRDFTIQGGRLEQSTINDLAVVTIPSNILRLTLDGVVLARRTAGTYVSDQGVDSVLNYIAE